MKTAEYWVHVWIDNADIEAMNNELAVLGRSVVGMLVDFRGEIPQGSGYKPDTVCARADKLRRVAADFRRAQELVAKLSHEEFLSAVEWVFLKGRNPPDADGRIISRQDAYRYMRGTSECFEQWNRAINRAFDKINAQLGVLEAK